MQTNSKRNSSKNIIIGGINMKLRLLFDLFNDIARARRIKENPEKQAKSVRFGVTSIVCSLLALPFSGLIFLFVQSLSSNNFVLIIGGILFGLGLGVGGAIALLYQAVKNWALQLYINKKPIAWVGLAISIISLIGCVGIVVYMLQVLG